MLKKASRFVVITRPLAQANLLAQRVFEIGREAVIFPLLEIHALRDPAPLLTVLEDLSSYAIVAFVSPNAINAVFTHVHNWPAHVALAVIGEGSRAALAQYGVTSTWATIISPNDLQRTDSQTLLDALDVDALRGKRVLIIRGETGRELLADALCAAEVQVTQIVAYRRLAPVLSTERQEQLRALLESSNDWIVTSSEALRILMRMVKQIDNDNGVAKMQRQKIIVSHVRIAETAQMLGFQKITTTGSGDERLLAALQFRT